MLKLYNWINNLNFLRESIMNDDPREFPRWEVIRKTMFVAMWSISEVPVYLRNLVLPLLSNFNAFLFGYQNQFGEVDNTEFFNEWKNSFNKEIVWKEWPILHIQETIALSGKLENWHKRQ